MIFLKALKNFRKDKWLFVWPSEIRRNTFAGDCISTLRITKSETTAIQALALKMQKQFLMLNQLLRGTELFQHLIVLST